MDDASFTKLRFAGAGGARMFAALFAAFATFAAGAAMAQDGAPAPLAQRIVRTAPPQLEPVEKEITPPGDVRVKPAADAVLLKPGKTSQTVQSLPVKRSYSVAQLRADPVIVLGKTRADLSPVFANPASLANVAGKLRSQPGLAQVVAEETEVLEVAQGLIIRQFLTYQIRPGVCTDGAKRSALGAAGVRCSHALGGAARRSAYADPGDPRYIPDAVKRSQAIAASDKAIAAQQADLDKNIAQFRAIMQDPVRRAEAEAELGPQEAARLGALGDDQLKAELVNLAQTQIEEIMFVPAEGRLQINPAARFTATPPLQTMQFPQKVDVDHALPRHVLLTGFTLGRETEWRRRVSITVKACVVGCKRTYFVEAYTGFGYGVGLRFPITVGGLYAYHRVGDQESASIAPVFQPIDGSKGDYEATGLAGDKLFDGQELVAELDAYAGMNFKVPFYSDGVSANVGADLTGDLPAPFAHGQFQPPAPGAGNALDREIVFDDPDLLGGLANYGVAGAKILPAIKVGVVSDRLALTLKDNISGTETVMLNSGQAYPLAVNGQDHSSSFSIGQPEYALAFHATPGLAARLFVDVAIWSNHWDWPVWFPQLTVTLPPEGMAFSCHEKTICSYNYRYSPTITQDEAGKLAPPDDPMEREVFNWREAYQTKWLDQCPYLPLRFCEVAIRAVAQTTGNQMLAQMGAVPQFPSIEAATIMIKKAIEADQRAKDIILETRIASIDHYGRNLFQTYEAVWNTGCADQLCRDRIHALGTPYVQALKNRQSASPAMEQSEVVFLENSQGGWAARAQEEVTASKTRARSRIRPVRRGNLELRR